MLLCCQHSLICAREKFCNFLIDVRNLLLKRFKVTSDLKSHPRAAWQVATRHELHLPHTIFPPFFCPEALWQCPSTVYDIGFASRIK